MRWPWRREPAPAVVRDVARVRLEPGDQLVVKYMVGFVDPRDLERLEAAMGDRGVEVVVVPVQGGLDVLEMVAVERGARPACWEGSE